MLNDYLLWKQHELDSIERRKKAQHKRKNRRNRQQANKSKTQGTKHADL